MVIAKPDALAHFIPPGAVLSATKIKLLVPTDILDNVRPFTVGFTRMFESLADVNDSVASNYPPYNIVKCDDENYIIEIAPAALQLNQEIRIPNKKNKEKEKPSKKDKKEVVAEKNKKKEIIPVVKEKPEVCNDEPVAATITHVVQSKETLYSLSKQFGLSMEAICELNPELKTNNLKKGLKLKFPNKDAVNLKLEDTNSNLDKAGSTNDDIVSITNVVHKVVAKETLYGISKQYGVSIADIEKSVPLLSMFFIKYAWFAIGPPNVVPVIIIGVLISKSPMSLNTT